MLHWQGSFSLIGRVGVIFALCSVFIFSTITTAMAGGLYLNEFGTSVMGTAGAGSAAYANDASTAWHNPAGMTRLEGRQVGAAAGLIFGEVKFDPDSDTPFDGGDGGDAMGLAPLVGTQYHWKANVDIGAAIVYADLGESEIENDKLLGEYESNDLIMIAFNFNWKL